MQLFKEYLDLPSLMLTDTTEQYYQLVALHKLWLIPMSLLKPHLVMQIKEAFTLYGPEHETLLPEVKRCQL